VKYARNGHIFFLQCLIIFLSEHIALNVEQ
jgi:hypothetical protein